MQTANLNKLDYAILQCESKKIIPHAYCMFIFTQMLFNYL